MNSASVCVPLWWTHSDTESRCDGHIVIFTAPVLLADYVTTGNGLKMASTAIKKIKIKKTNILARRLRQFLVHPVSSCFVKYADIGVTRCGWSSSSVFFFFLLMFLVVAHVPVVDIVGCLQWQITRSYCIVCGKCDVCTCCRKLFLSGHKSECPDCRIEHMLYNVFIKLYL